jgi:hypothetical protein
MGPKIPTRKPIGVLASLLVASIIGAACSGSSDVAEPTDRDRPPAIIELAKQTVSDASSPSQAIVVATTSTTTTTIDVADPPPPPPPGGGGQAAPTGNEVAFEAGGLETVGTDVIPGLYIAQAGGEFCSWERTTSDGTIVDNIFQGQIIQEILASDTEFRSDFECGSWEPYAAPATPAMTIDEGHWAVNQQIVPGTYRTDETTFDFCYWERSSAFTLTAEEIIVNGIESEQVDVEILATDTRFVSSGCGTWTLVS